MACVAERTGFARKGAGGKVAREKGADWDRLSGDQQVALIKAGADETRHRRA